MAVLEALEASGAIMEPRIVLILHKSAPRRCAKRKIPNRQMNARTRSPASSFVLQVRSSPCTRGTAYIFADRRLSGPLVRRRACHHPTVRRSTQSNQGSSHSHHARTSSLFCSHRSATPRGMGCTVCCQLRDCSPCSRCTDRTSCQKDWRSQLCSFRNRTCPR